MLQFSLKRYQLLGILAILALAACSPAANVSPAVSGNGIDLPALAAKKKPMAAAGTARPSHIVVVVEENHSFADIIGNSAAPYINSLADQGLLFTNYVAITHPSQPNYFALYSGSTQNSNGSDACPAPYSLAATSLGGQLKSAQLSFTGYVEQTSDCNHDPWESFADSRGLETDFSQFPTNYASLPQVSFVIPNPADDMHDGTIAQADSWLQRHLDGYVQWAKTNQSLFILVWDEDDYTQNNQVPAIMVGSGVTAGTRDATPYTPYSTLKFIEQSYNLPFLANAQSATVLGAGASGPAPCTEPGPHGRLPQDCLPARRGED